MTEIKVGDCFRCHCTDDSSRYYLYITHVHPEHKGDRVTGGLVSGVEVACPLEEVFGRSWVRLEKYLWVTKIQKYLSQGFWETAGPDTFKAAMNAAISDMTESVGIWSESETDTDTVV